MGLTTLAWAFRVHHNEDTPMLHPRRRKLVPPVHASTVHHQLRTRPPYPGSSSPDVLIAAAKRANSRAPKGSLTANTQHSSRSTVWADWIWSARTVPRSACFSERPRRFAASVPLNGD